MIPLRQHFSPEPRDSGPARFQHAVFPDLDPAGARHVINFAPQHAAPHASESVVELADDELSLVRWIFRHASIGFRSYRHEVLKRRIPSLLRALRVGSVGEASARLQRDAQMIPVAVNSLVIGVTGFFRDPEVFGALRDDVLPGLLEQRPTLKIWSVGCSEGAELYSIAILLAERGVLKPCTLLGTDCRTAATATAESGVFDAESLRGVPPEFRAKYFTQQGNRWCIMPELRRAVSWRTADVLAAREEGPWDLILCRNLAIYLRAAAVTSLWSGLREALRDGGVLAVGKAERPAAAVIGLRPAGPSLYRRVGS